jgi:hypothetical protein
MQQIDHIIDFIAGRMAIQRYSVIAPLTVVPGYGNPMTGITVRFTAASGAQVRWDHQLSFQLISLDNQMTTVAGKQQVLNAHSLSFVDLSWGIGKSVAQGCQGAASADAGRASGKKKAPQRGLDADAIQ